MKNMIKKINKKNIVVISISALCVIALGVVSSMYVLDNIEEKGKVVENKKTSTDNKKVSSKEETKKELKEEVKKETKEEVHEKVQDKKQVVKEEIKKEVVDTKSTTSGKVSQSNSGNTGSSNVTNGSENVVTPPKQPQQTTPQQPQPVVPKEEVKDDYGISSVCGFTDWNIPSEFYGTDEETRAWAKEQFYNENGKHYMQHYTLTQCGCFPDGTERVGVEWL